MGPEKLHKEAWLSTLTLKNESKALSGPPAQHNWREAHN